MTTDSERLADDIKANGFDPKTILTSTHIDDTHAQRAYIALKLFQIEQHMRRIADTMARSADGAEG